jgi:hypothetical protein
VQVPLASTTFCHAQPSLLPDGHLPYDTAILPKVRIRRSKNISRQMRRFSGAKIEGERGTYSVENEPLECGKVCRRVR